MSRTYYFAARYSHNPVMRGLRDSLLEKIPSARVTSRWIDLHGGTLSTSVDPAVFNADPAGNWHFGAACVNDVKSADTLVFFSEPSGGGKGGRHVEFGIALALDKRTVVIGPLENIFHTGPKTERYSTWEEFLLHEVNLSKPTPTPLQVLEVVMGDPNDAKASTVGEYLTALLSTLWTRGENFSGKRPFGNSSWPYEVYSALGRAGYVDATFDEDGLVEEVDSVTADRLILEAIDFMLELIEDTTARADKSHA